MPKDLPAIFNQFNATGTYLSGDAFGSGHIHDTYRIITAEKGCDNYILQRINHSIFSNVPALQENIARVTSHIRSKLAEMKVADGDRRCLTPVPLRGSDLTWLMDDDGSYWRMFVFIPDHRTYEHVQSSWQALEGGKAVGRFQALLADLPGGPLHETIPFFHNIEKRLESFHRAIENDAAGRLTSIKRETEAVIRREEVMKTIIRLGRQGIIPLRITHNDTKFNNILFDTEDKALCLIDLDTVMPGYVHYDFGDAIRTAACTTEEDEPDTGKVSMNIEIFRAFATGYLSEAGDTLNKAEKDNLALAPALLTYTMATRFLTDYIEGDVYYKINHPQHNLQRVRAQLKLLESMEEHYDEMQVIIRDLC